MRPPKNVAAAPQGNIMRPKSMLLLLLALGCGLVASIGISQVMEHNSGSQAKLETVPIYVAVHNINLGDPIDSAAISLQEWPKGKVPKGAINKLEDLKGRRPRTAIFEGEPILEGKLLAPGQMADPISQIKPGMRLKTIAVDAEKSVAGLLKPGDRVDVQLFVKKDQHTGVDTAKSKVILQNIRVFAVDQAVQRAADGSDEKAIAKTVSLMLTPEQASKLSLAEQIGEISLIPRNPDDEESTEALEYTVGDLLAGTDKNSRAKEQGTPAKTTETAPNPTESLSNAIASVPKKEPFKMEIVEAAEVHEVLFDAETGKPIRPVSEQTSANGTSGASGTSQHASTKSHKTREKKTDAPSFIGGDQPTDVPGAGDGDSTSLEEFPINLNDLRKK
jgi:pilus assembly protein CpaB